LSVTSASYARRFMANFFVSKRLLMFSDDDVIMVEIIIIMRVLLRV